MYSAIYTSTLLEESIKNNIRAALEKLQETHISPRLRFIYYLRVSCSTLRKIQSIEQRSNLNTYQARPYSELIALLIRYDRAWWERCHLSPVGLLDSDDPVIYRLLQPILELHYLVQLLKVTQPIPPNIVFMNSTKSSPEERMA